MNGNNSDDILKLFFNLRIEIDFTCVLIYFAILKSCEDFFQKFGVKYNSININSCLSIMQISKIHIFNLNKSIIFIFNLSPFEL